MPASEFIFASSIEEQKLAIKSSWGEAELALPFVGRFNVSNALGVLGCLIAQGVPFAEAVRLLERLPPVPGRMQKVSDRPLVVVDYAHTPDALDKVLAALEPVAKARGGRLVAVFGAGGERDAAKRPQMGLAASRRADRIVLTSDNPRSEDPLGSSRRSAAAWRRSARWTLIARGRSRRDCGGRRRRRLLLAGKGTKAPMDRRAEPAVLRCGGGRRRARPPGDGMMSLHEASVVMGGRAVGGDVPFSGVSTDTRTLKRDELFVAIRGEHYDAHDFLDTARERNAAAALVDEKGYRGHAPLPVAIVDDTRKALGRLGRHWRLRFAPSLVALTGSNGKTTTKEMLASILRRHAGVRCARPRAHLNTDIGVPLALARAARRAPRLRDRNWA